MVWVRFFPNTRSRGREAFPLLPQMGEVICWPCRSGRERKLGLDSGQRGNERAWDPAGFLCPLRRGVDNLGFKSWSEVGRWLGAQPTKPTSVKVEIGSSASKWV